MVENVLAAPSEEVALAVVADVARDNPTGGPDGQVVVRNQKARRMRMVLPQVLNLRPPEELYEADTLDRIWPSPKKLDRQYWWNGAPAIRSSTLDDRQP